MRLLSQHELAEYRWRCHYIPHHGIWQRSDGGRKLRVVFNASRPTSTGRSLNDALHAGPKLQSHIATGLTRWRLHEKAFCADIKMMFRQVNIDPCHAHLQRILWSPSSEVSAQHYALQTITYGTACAPYLALRTLRQLCADKRERFPLAAELVERDLYMDDFLSGSHDLAFAKALRDQLIDLLTAGGFNLKKWVANDPDLLEAIPPDDRLRPSWRSFSTGGPVNELGMDWDPVLDRFQFRQPQACADPVLTKRKVLSELARVFDPVGWLAPTTLVAKLIIQDLWRARLEWDEALPRSWSDRWLAYRDREGLSSLASVSIPRWLGYTPTSLLQLHAFSDASRRAMAGVLYSRADVVELQCRTTLLVARTNLNSIKSLLPLSKPPSRMTIPRLELRAALIAAELLSSLAATINVPPSACHLWSDSSIVLHWVRSADPVGNDLVDNYIARIQELSTGVHWHHVPTDQNPADIASRGADALKLVGTSAWWTGPEWLAGPHQSWPGEEPLDSDEQLVEPLAAQCCLAQMRSKTIRDHIGRFSSLDALLRATARVCRWRHHSIHPNPRKFLAPVTAAELGHAFVTCVRISQQQCFAAEIEHLNKRNSKGKLEALRGQSPLTALEPFLDAHGVLRIGGRLDRSTLPYNERHPALLDGRAHLALLVIRWAHDCSLHSGFRGTYARTIQLAWITGGKVRVKRHIRQCLVCVRLAARTASQGMAPLPAVRVTPSRPFSKCGVDYAGPFSLCRSRGRGMATFKGYIALFVCMSTKAVHLELVGDLTTASFLGALTRFIGRRGRPSEIWSDNGTNFRGADLELQRLLKEAEVDWKCVDKELAQEGVTWKFIPPGAPHFGGLWEAGVKSMKAHLSRVVGPRRLTYEEFYTVLVSIEMILNSWPLTPPSGDLGDLEALTPSHFLIGTSATSHPQPSSPEASLDRDAHWELVKAMKDSFWGRWSKEYLNTLIQRPKWRSVQPDLSVGDFVVVVDPSLLRPDGRWPLGKIEAVYPGRDGLVRTTTVRTATGQYLRPIVKLARLPLRDSSGEKPVG